MPPIVFSKKLMLCKEPSLSAAYPSVMEGLFAARVYGEDQWRAI